MKNLNIFLIQHFTLNYKSLQQQIKANNFIQPPFILKQQKIMLKTSKQSAFLIKTKSPINKQKLNNIFQLSKQDKVSNKSLLMNQTNNNINNNNINNNNSKNKISDMMRPYFNSTIYSICGDMQFKNKFITITTATNDNNTIDSGDTSLTRQQQIIDGLNTNTDINTKINANSNTSINANINITKNISNSQKNTEENRLWERRKSNTFKEKLSTNCFNPQVEEEHYNSKNNNLSFTLNKRFVNESSGESSIDLARSNYNQNLNQTLDFSNNNIHHGHNKTIYISPQKQKTFLSKLSKDQKNLMTRQKRSLQYFIKKQQTWQKIQSHLKTRMIDIQQSNLKQSNKQTNSLNSPKKQICSTMTFDSIKKIYYHPNPQKITIVNDMIPQYWKNSLRDNTKRLKHHIKGNKYKKQNAQQMLQTISGTKKLQNSIPKIEHLQGSTHFCSKAMSKKRFCYSLSRHKNKPQKLQNLQNQQTHTSFDIPSYPTLNSLKLRGRNLAQKRTNQYKSSYIVYQCNNNNQNIDTKQQQPSSRETMRKHHKDLLVNLNQTMKIQNKNLETLFQSNTEGLKYFKFCETLQKLDHIDNQIYQRKYERKNKWLNQGLQTLS